MLEMMRKNIYQFEMQGLSTPDLTKMCATDPIFFSRTINRMEDRHGSKISMAK